MSCTPDEFRRSLVQAFGDAVTDTADGLLLAGEAACLHFSLSEQQPRRIAALQLSTLRVEISVRAGDEAAARRLLAQVDRATLRGGG